MALQNAMTVLEFQLCTYRKEEVSDASLPQIEYVQINQECVSACRQGLVEGDILKM